MTATITRILGEEHLPLFDEVLAVLDGHSPVEQMIALELAVARLAMQTGSLSDAQEVADGHHKHVKQMIDQCMLRHAAI